MPTSTTASTTTREIEYNRELAHGEAQIMRRLRGAPREILELERESLVRSLKEKYFGHYNAGADLYFNWHPPSPQRTKVHKENRLERDEYLLLLETN